MSGCQWLSDRMPAVALGAAEWTADEVHHLSGCRSCQEEWKVLQRSSRLGREIGLSLEASSASETLLGQLDHARVERLRRRT